MRCQAALALGYLVDEPGVRGVQSKTLPLRRLRDTRSRLRADDVRAAAAAALKPYAGETQVRAALEQARLDPVLVVRRAAQLALGTAAAE